MGDALRRMTTTSGIAPRAHTSARAVILPDVSHGAVRMKPISRLGWIYVRDHLCRLRFAAAWRTTVDIILRRPRIRIGWRSKP